LTIFVIFIIISHNIVVNNLKFTYNSNYWFNFDGLNGSHFDMLSNITNNFEQNNSNALLFKHLLAIESIRLWNYTSEKSDPVKSKLFYADYVKYNTILELI
jgi:hypothetical protein